MEDKRLADDGPGGTGNIDCDSPQEGLQDGPGSDIGIGGALDDETKETGAYEPRGDSGTDFDGDDSEESGEPSGKDKEKSRMDIYDWVQCIISAVLCGIFIFVFFGRTIGVEGDSMLPTLHWYDRVIMWSLFYTPKNGDIVVFRSPHDSFHGTPLVKRVIAVEGQTVTIDFDKGEVFVDGVLLNEPYIRDLTHNRIHFENINEPIPEGYIFVMGDNRNNSADSRDARIGLVDTRYILGKVLFIAIPGGTSQSARDWGRFGPIPG